MRRLFLIILQLTLLFACGPRAQAGLKLYYLRHAEGGHNVVDEWKAKKIPKEQWPSYVGNENIFTPKGEQQVLALTPRLKAMHFDFIATSPKWRTKHTILPYLQETNGHSEIWPELEEFSDPSGNLKPGTVLPPPSPDLFTGKPVAFSPEEEPFFSIRPDRPKRFKLGQGDPQIVANIQASLDAAIARLKAQFSGQEKSVLFVGHGTSGKRLLRTLLKDRMPDKVTLINTGIWMVEEQADQSFVLRMLNDQPVEEAQPKGK